MYSWSGVNLAQYFVVSSTKEGVLTSVSLTEYVDPVT